MLKIPTKTQSQNSSTIFSSCLKVLLSIALLLIQFNVKAEKLSEECEDSQLDCVEENVLHLGLSIGIGLKTNPLFESDNIPLILLPQISYYSGNFFIENLDVGYGIYETSDTSISVIATPSYDSVYFNRWDPGNVFVELSTSGAALAPSVEIQPEDQLTQINPDELSQRDFSYLGGLEYTTDFEKSQIQFSFLTDLTGTHSGTEMRFAYGISLSENFTTTLGFTWKDQNLTNYYYGITENEIVDDRATFVADASFNPFVRATYKFNLNDGDGWRISFQYLQLDSQINNSPIVADDYVVTFFAGKTFNF